MPSSAFRCFPAEQLLTGRPQRGSSLWTLWRDAQPSCGNTEDDEDILRQLINFRFSRATLTSTWYGMNTQKSEATHRGYSKSNPKNVTYARNFQPQIFSAIHCMNHGPEQSAAMKFSVLGAPITEGTRVCRQLQNKRNISRTKQGKGRSKTGPRTFFG